MGSFTTDSSLGFGLEVLGFLILNLNQMFRNHVC